MFEHNKPNTVKKKKEKTQKMFMKSYKLSAKYIGLKIGINIVCCELSRCMRVVMGQNNKQKLLQL